MRKLILAVATVASLGLAACGAPVERDDDDDDRYEQQREREDDDD